VLWAVRLADQAMQVTQHTLQTDMYTFQTGLL
jgi:hypothetical protein